MSGLSSVSVSLATYKAIEARRMSFAETHDAILQRALATDVVSRTNIAVRAKPHARGAPRRRGKVRVLMFGQERPAFNLRDAYLIILTGLTRHKASLLHLLAVEGSARRRWVAPSPDALFVGAPHLATEHAHRIAPDWYVDTNVSRAQVMARLSVAARLADCSFGKDVNIIEG